MHTNIYLHTYSYIHICRIYGRATGSMISARDTESWSILAAARMRGSGEGIRRVAWEWWSGKRPTKYTPVIVIQNTHTYIHTLHTYIHTYILHFFNDFEQDNGKTTYRTGRASISGEKALWKDPWRSRYAISTAVASCKAAAKASELSSTWMARSTPGVGWTTSKKETAFTSTRMEKYSQVGQLLF